jgi:pSer/pThr/pTyr-binding forkhead associated (FHA) protein
MPRLIALTDQARRALRGDFLIIDRLPFRIGRESRLGTDDRPPNPGKERRHAGLSVNDLYIIEEGGVLHVSREHFLIEEIMGEYFLVDRGSLNGTIVEGRAIGGDRRGGRLHIQDHHVIIVGSSTSPFVFKFRVN